MLGLVFPSVFVSICPAVRKRQRKRRLDRRYKDKGDPKPIRNQLPLGTLSFLTQSTKKKQWKEIGRLWQERESSSSRSFTFHSWTWISIPLVPFVTTKLLFFMTSAVRLVVTKDKLPHGQLCSCSSLSPSIRRRIFFLYILRRIEEREDHEHKVPRVKTWPDFEVITLVPYVGRVRENRLWAGLEKIKKETGARPQTIDSLSHLGFLVLVDSELVFLVLPVL